MKKGNKEGRVDMTSFIFPHQDDIADETKSKKVKKLFGVDQQGIFIYRENRLIEGPVWLGDLKRETHLNRLRISLDYESTIDHMFTVDVRKKGINVEQKLLTAIEDECRPVRREADLRARNRNKAPKGGAGKNASERTIEKNKDALKGPELSKNGQQVTMINNQTEKGEEIELIDLDGNPNPALVIEMDTDAKGTYINYKSDIRHNALWEPSLSPQGTSVQVSIGTTHDWYRKTILANQDNRELVHSIEFLLFAIAQAEMNNTDVELCEVYEDFRVEVSRNLKRLVNDLPEPSDD